MRSQFARRRRSLVARVTRDACHVMTGQRSGTTQTAFTSSKRRVSEGAVKAAFGVGSEGSYKIGETARRAEGTGERSKSGAHAEAADKRGSKGPLHRHGTTYAWNRTYARRNRS